MRQLRQPDSYRFCIPALFAEFQASTEWNPEDIDVILLEPQQVVRLAYIPGAISMFTEDESSSRLFLNFLASAEGQQIFSNWGYLASEEEARQYAPDAETGGEYQLPVDYTSLVK